MGHLNSSVKGQKTFLNSLARATPVWKNRGLVTALHTTSSDGMQLADMVGRAAVALWNDVMVKEGVSMGTPTLVESDIR